MNRASLEKRPEEVAAMFDDVAPKYDVVNDVLSMGQTRRWRRIVVDAVDAKPGQRVLDVAAGTGTSSEPYADAGVAVVACDFSVGMLKVGKRRRPDIDFIAGDATNLPFADNSFDATTISFGLRNVSEPQEGPRGDAAGHQTRRHAGHCRVLPAHHRRCGAPCTPNT